MSRSCTIQIKEIRRDMDAPTKLTGSFGEFLRSAAKGFFGFLAAASEAYDSLPLEQKHRAKTMLLKLSSPDAEATHFLFKEDRELAEVLSRYEWWVLERDINGSIQRDILRLGREGTRKEIDEYLCALFREDNHARLEKKVVAWLKTAYLAEHRQIIAQCLAAHKEGKFFLSVATLLPLVNGLTRRFRRETFGTQPQKSSTGAPRRRKAVEVALLAEYYQSHEPPLWGQPLFEAIKSKFYGDYGFGSGPAPTSLNRHGILHGEILDYGTEVNSLKVFLLLDTFQHFCKSVQERKTREAAA
jgi:hypothetical protein